MKRELQYLKQALSMAPVRTTPTKDDNLQLHTDASDVGIGAVLSVLRDNGDRPGGLFLEKTTSMGIEICHDREGMAIVEAI